MRELCIFLSTFNGKDYLSEQLETIKQQSYENWDLVISDDGSSDQTLKICEEFKRNVRESHDVIIINGPRQGFARNFLSMAVNQQFSAKYYAFADQDDIWYKDKLSKGVNWLRTIGQEIPAMYCTRTELIKRNGEGFEPKRYSHLMRQLPCFENALVQSIAGGNTMVFNQAARKELIKFGGAVDVVSHDWWLYIVVTSVGGTVYYDPWPSMGYRQHGGNLIGSNRGLKALVLRGWRFARGDFRRYNERNIVALSKNVNYMNEKSKRCFIFFKHARCSNLLKRIVFLFKSGVRREGIQDILLKIGILFNKI